MTPQELIDLPGYGKANKRVKAMGAWLTTMTDEERIEWIAENVSTINRSDNGMVWFFDTRYEEYDPDILRMDIDNAASEYTAQLEATE